MVDSKLIGAYRILATWTFLTAGEVSKWLSIPPRKVLMFVEQGLVLPTDPSPGSGKSRKYSFTDLVLFAVVGKLDALGIAPRYLRTLAQDLDSAIRHRMGQQKQPGSLLCVTQGEGESLRLVVGDDSQNLASVTLLVDIAKIELEVLEIFQRNAPVEAGGRELLGMIGREYDGLQIDQLLRDKGTEKAE